jgi:predicted DCC family thiol-disulfide oxidoreductase YuxK
LIPQNVAADASAAGPVAFFDGVCNLCNGTVNFLIDRDRGGRLRFAPLQGSTFASVAAAHPELQGIDSFVLWEAGRVHVRSSAAVRILMALGGAWRLSAALLAVPAPVRDRLYDFVARRRYRWFGRTDACRVPTPALRARFLD